MGWMAQGTAPIKSNQAQRLKTSVDGVDEAADQQEEGEVAGPLGVAELDSQVKAAAPPM